MVILCGFGLTYMVVIVKISENPLVKCKIVILCCVVSRNRCPVNQVQSKKNKVVVVVVLKALLDI